VAYEIVSHVDGGRITATVEMPSRKPPQTVMLRFRHPQARPIKSVTLNGQNWQAFNTDKEVIRVTGVQGTVTIVANY
jgi:hypothetical protein